MREPNVKLFINSVKPQCVPPKMLTMIVELEGIRLVVIEESSCETSMSKYFLKLSFNEICSVHKLF